MMKGSTHPPHLLTALTSFTFIFLFCKQPITVSALDLATLREFSNPGLAFLTSICVVACVIFSSPFKLPEEAKKDGFGQPDYAIMAETMDTGRGTGKEGKEAHPQEEDVSITGEEDGQQVPAHDEEQKEGEPNLGNQTMVYECVEEEKEMVEFNKRIEEFILKFRRQIKSEELR